MARDAEAAPTDRTDEPLAAAKLRLCLAASGGGHLRQLLDLEPVWSQHDAFLVTENTALGLSVAEKVRARFVPHVALGQARQGAVLRMILSGARSFWLSARMMWRERPEVVITTGAGTVFLPVFWAWALGAKIVFIESFARLEGLSLFGRMVAPFATVSIVQSGRLQAFLPQAMVFDPLRSAPAPALDKEPLVLVTVGATLPFDRLTQMMGDLKSQGAIPERVIAQTGPGGRAVPGLECAEGFSFDAMQGLLDKADLVVCHAGTGSLITALRAGCRVVAVPRRSDLQEVYDDHQLEIAQCFAERGLIEVAQSAAELPAAFERARSRERVTATTDHRELVGFLKTQLGQWASSRTRGRAAGVVALRERASQAR